jgi:sulfatase maturation enzyme AslB (radical SAM superfamily)
MTTETFCVLPWFGREISWNQQQTHCCLLPEKYNIEQIKSDMLTGCRSSACQACWNLEDQGLTSDRQLKNSALDWYWDRDLELIAKDAAAGHSEILMLKLLTSFTCNATCVSCNDWSSSSWSQLRRRMYPLLPARRHSFVDIDIVKTQVNFQNLKMLSLIGGEPLYEKRNFDLLEHILELGNDKVFLSLVTNGSVTLIDRQKQVLSRFQNINFCVSIDGTGPVFEYLRFPLKWDDILKNLEFFREVTDNVSANYTLSNLNLLYHNQTVAWFNDNNIRFSLNPIYDPAWLQPRSLPLAVKQHLKNQLTDVDYATYLGDDHRKHDQRQWDNCLRNIAKQDEAKGIDWRQYLPELAQLTA